MEEGPKLNAGIERRLGGVERLSVSRGCWGMLAVTHGASGGIKDEAEQQLLREQSSHDNVSPSIIRP